MAKITQCEPGLTKWMVSKGVDTFWSSTWVLQMAMYFFPIMFLLPKDSLGG